jgi:hypothetical protein
LRRLITDAAAAAQVTFLISYCTRSSPPIVICHLESIRETFQLATRLYLDSTVKFVAEQVHVVRVGVV